MISLFTMVFINNKVYAVDKIEGGNVTIESLGSIIKSLATKVQIFGIVLSFIALVVLLFNLLLGMMRQSKDEKDNIIYFRWRCSLNISSFNNKFCYRYIGVICYKC